MIIYSHCHVVEHHRVKKKIGTSTIFEKGLHSLHPEKTNFGLDITSKFVVLGYVTINPMFFFSNGQGRHLDVSNFQPPNTALY